MMLAFDAPVFSESCERRSVTTTPLQALSMLNGDLVNEEAAHLARADRDGSRGRPGSPDRARVRAGAEPAARSRTNCEKFAAFPDTLDGICRVLLNSNEFLYVE